MKHSLPTDSDTRKNIPMAAGLLDYFPAALAAVAHISYIGNEKHNPGEPLHHARGKSMDHADCIVRHLADRGTIDTVKLKDGREFKVRHSAYVAWRALALLQEELEREEGAPLPRGARLSTEAPSTRPVDDARPWTPWYGSREDGPMLPDRIVEVRLRIGDTGSGTVSSWEWLWAGDNHPGDIVAWRPA